MIYWEMKQKEDREQWSGIPLKQHDEAVLIEKMIFEQRS